MTDLPEPLTPADCDLRGLTYMPLDVSRLLDSDLYICSSGDEFKAALTLWAKSFFQVPAGSLPDDDRILSHMSGAGAKWSKVKAMALRGFIKCLDGRLYHPVVCEKALEAWQSRMNYRDRMAKARQTKAEKRNAAPSITGSMIEPITEPMIEPVTGLKGREEKRREEKKKDDIHPPPLSPPARPEPSDPASQIIRAFDDARCQIFGEQTRRRWRAALDATEAADWLSRGATPEIVRSACLAACERLKAKGKGPPDTLWYLSRDVIAALADKPAPKPLDALEWQAMVERWWLEGYWHSGWGPTPGNPGSPITPLMLQWAEERHGKNRRVSNG